MSASLLLLPVTYTMDPLAGITLLMGLYAAGWYGGAIPAITINTPGTGVNVLTTYDGYPMARAGEPQRACRSPMPLHSWEEHSRSSS